jgi:hypothetical protein
MLAGIARKERRMRFTLLHSDNSRAAARRGGTDYGWLGILDQRLTDHQALSDLTNSFWGTPMVLDRSCLFGRPER